MGMIPLYKHEEMDIMPQEANTGLWYDKFCNQWPDDWDKLGDNKKYWIQTVTEKNVGNKKEINQIVKRRKKMVENGSGSILLFKTDGRFVTGLGKNHPVENGFAWHHSLGTPYIPGSSVKGMVREYARELKEEGKIQAKDIDRIFGSDGNSDSHVGSVIFMDAIPYSQIRLSSDIMTPHYGPYYSGGKIPGDWHDPTPIPFLTVDKDQYFLFGIIPRNNAEDKDVELVQKWLMEALEWSGAGAKTNVGYGRFTHVEIKSPAENWLEEIAKDYNKDVIKIVLDLSKVLKTKWEGISDKDLKKSVALLLKKELIRINIWEKKGWGGPEKLKKVLKPFLVE